MLQAVPTEVIIEPDDKGLVRVNTYTGEPGRIIDSIQVGIRQVGKYDSLLVVSHWPHKQEDILGPLGEQGLAAQTLLDYTRKYAREVAAELQVPIKESGNLVDAIERAVLDAFGSESILQA